VCPSYEDLLAFHHGTLPEPDVDALADHLDTCTDCLAALKQLDASADPVLAALRQPVPAEPENWPSLPGYEVLGILGRGGMGIVYKARQVRLNRAVALKRLRGNAQTLGRSQAEAEALGALQHANIVQIHEVIEHQGYTYLALELVEGGSLAGHLTGKPHSARDSAALVEVIARAVHHAHQKGIIHRDLKPSNILLTGSPGCQPVAGSQASSLCYVPKVSDFGVAKRLRAGPGETLEGDVIGTPTYMAPEQAAGKVDRVGPAADVYGLGVLLYEMLTGRVPLQAPTTMETLLLVVSEEPVAPRRLQPGVPRDLETICLKCLHKEPAKRYASALALADDLERFLLHRPILARPTPAWERLGKAARRRPGMTALTAAVVLITVLGLALVSWQWLRADAEARRAVKAESVAEEGRRRAEEAEARLALRQGLALCEQGDVGPGVLWLAHALERAGSAGATDLDRPLRINLAEWGRRLPPPVIRLDHAAPVQALAFDPTGRTLVSGGKDGKVHFWDVARQREVGPPLVAPLLSKPVAWVGCVEFSPDGRTLATVSHGAAVLWDAATRRPIGEPMLHPPGMIWGMTFLSGGRLATCTFDGYARVWDLATRKVVLGPLRHFGPPGYYTLAVSPDHQTLVTAGQNGLVWRWDLKTGEPIEPALRHDSCVLAAVFSRDGRKLLTTVRGGTLHVWDLRTGRANDLPANSIEVNSVALSPNGQLFATGTADGLVRLWHTDSLSLAGPVYRQRSGVPALAFSPNGRLLALGTERDGIRIIAVPPSPEAAPPIRIEHEIHAVAYSPAGDRLLVGTSEGARWLPDSGNTPRFSPEKYALTCTALSPDGRTVALGRWDGEPPAWRGRVEVWDACTGKPRWVSSRHPDPIRVVVYRGDGRVLFSCCGQPDLEGGAALWDVDNGRQIRSLLKGTRLRVRRAVFHPAGRFLLLACDDGRARLWDVEADTEIEPDRPMTHSGAVSACAFDAAGHRILTGCRDGTVWLWDAETRQPLLAPLRHEAEVTALAFSPDGQTLLSASLDGTARFWDAATGTPLGPTLRHPGVLTAAFHPAGQRAATAGKDHTVRQWTLPGAPLPGEPEQIRLWAEVHTGLELDERQAIRALGPETLRERRGRLQELGGPPSFAVTSK
jgi:WD40 repeat protein